MNEDIFVTNKNLLEKCYKNSNYKVVTLNLESKNTLICFSSHALYYPFTQQAFIEKIITRDCYEFNSLSENAIIKHHFGKIIFLRDLYREWYVKGISAENNSIIKIIELLKILTKDENIYTLGVSSGGYLATIAGIELKAKAVFSLSGQFSLEQWMGRRYISYYKNDNEHNKYYSLVEYVKHTDVPIFYFCPYNSKDDRQQYNLVKNIKNVYSFLFKYDAHGRTIDKSIIVQLMNKIENLKKYANRDLLWTDVLFVYKVLGLLKMLQFWKLTKKCKPKYIKDVLAP